MVTDADARPFDATRAVEAEEALIGAVLMDPSILAEIGDLGEDAFCRRQHAMVLEACRAVAAAGAVPDLVTVSERLDAAGQLARIGGFSFLADLGAAMPTAANAPHYAGRVRDAWARRRAQRHLEAALRLVVDGLHDPTDAAAKATEAVRALTENRRPSYMTLAEAAAARADDYADAIRGPAA